jgi:hypothetical protein
MRRCIDEFDGIDGSDEQCGIIDHDEENGEGKTTERPHRRGPYSRTWDSSCGRP